MIFQFAEDGVAEFLVEAKSLEGKRVQPYACAVALAGDVFGLLHEAGSRACPTEIFGDKEELDEEPFIGGAAPETTNGGAVFVLEKQTEETEVGVGCGLEVVLDKALEDGFALGGNVLFDDADGGKHRERIALKWS